MSSLAIALLLAPIVGGSIDVVDPAVVHVEVAGAICTGALIAPTIVLTAAHCVIPDESGTVSVGPGEGAFTEAASIVDAIAYRYHDGQGTPDLGLLRLDAPLSPTPLVFRRALASALEGRAVRVVGYGLTQPDEPASGGTKHEVTLGVHAVDGPLLVVGAADETTCTGDSGGPALLDLGDGEEIIAVVSFGDAGCLGEARLARVDLFAAFVDTVVAAWTSVEPLAPCELDGACAAGCATTDLDCPVEGLPGVTCDDELDCDGRLCVTAPEDEQARFCSVACDPAAEGADCPVPLGRCRDGACFYAAATPGVLGAACEDDDACRSAICDRNAGSCAVPCRTGGVCPDGFACEPVGAGAACTVPGGGCCSSGGGGGGDDVVVVALLLPLLRRRRVQPRRDRRAQQVA